jgi:hypothetical protein
MPLLPEQIDCEFDGEADSIDIDSLVRQTDSAVLVKIEEEDVWIPKSLVAHVEKDRIWIATWFIRKKGL